MSTQPSGFQRLEDRLKAFAHTVRADVDKALPLIERVIAVAGAVYPIIGKVGTPLIQAVIKAEAAEAQGSETGQPEINKLGSVVEALGPQIQAALAATGHDKAGETVESTITKVVNGLRTPSQIPQAPAS